MIDLFPVSLTIFMLGAIHENLSFSLDHRRFIDDDGIGAFVDQDGVERDFVIGA